MATLDIRAQIVLTKKSSQKMMHVEKEGDFMADVRIVEDGVRNTQTAGTTKRSRKDRKITEKVQM